MMVINTMFGDGYQNYVWGLARASYMQVLRTVQLLRAKEPFGFPRARNGLVFFWHGWKLR